MKSTNILFPSLVLGIAGGFVFSGCVEQKQSPTAEIDTLKKDTTVYLQAGKETPSCKIGISYAYLKPASDKDSVSLLIDSEIQKEAFGGICGDPDKRFYPELSYGCEGAVRGRHAQRHESGRCSGMV